MTAGDGPIRRPPFGVIILAAGSGGTAVLIKHPRSIEVPPNVVAQQIESPSSSCALFDLITCYEVIIPHF